MNNDLPENRPGESSVSADTLSSKIVPAGIVGIAVAVAAILVSSGFIQSPQDTLAKEITLERRLAGMESQLQRIADNLDTQTVWTGRDMESWIFQMKVQNPEIDFVYPSGAQVKTRQVK